MSGGARKWVGNLLLRTPASVRSIRKVPVLGGLVHRLSHRVLSNEEKIWEQIEAGPSKGLWIELNPRTGRSYLLGEAEVTVQKALADELRPGMVFYDLGANIGLFSLLGARIVGRSGRVFSFEPDPETAMRLARNVERNAFQNIAVVRKGVWSASGEQRFAPAGASSPDHGTGSFVANGNAANGVPVGCVALDDFIRQAPAPNAIKCDVEGAELEVLRGAEHTFREHRPWILCEMHSGANDRACRELLQEFGYNVSAVDSSHVLGVPQGVRKSAT
jgi:FkbM family methyltransferase